MTTASICTIGDEILIGQIVDTNSSEISRELGNLGIKVNRMISIGDNHDEIISTLSKELTDNEIVITTGGLGPTKDDITKAALAELSGSTRYVEHEAQLAKIHEILHARGLDVLDINRQQAMVPDTCEVILNKWGTAPIMVFRFPAERFGHAATLYSMPGVPFETTNALPDVIDDIRTHNDITSICHKTVMTYGMAESALSKKIEAWEDALPEDMHLAYLPNPLTGVRLRLSIYGGDREDEQKRIDAEIAKLKAILGDLIYSECDDTLENAIGRILKKTGKTLSAAESCTGGEISHLITTVPGSSSYYLGSVTSYAIPVKENVLGVTPLLILEHGVVSSEVAAAMADGVRRLTGSDYSVATTGFAGPGGGDERYPEGTVWVGVATPDGIYTKMFQYHNDRKRNIERFAASALYFLLQHLQR
ncbi:MAG: CinA family nicotinamide mononucleotide deamidase-related protein [Bacteroidales bacterium]|nr:CinA family nicotinamide mononucleotide deamidase-related protein [Bacteroidales bacterium]MBQ3997508.1 CinA family nicotinamide mononucleotide deamidase-related protein [Bacteroidales bacterium]